MRLRPIAGRIGRHPRSPWYRSSIQEIDPASSSPVKADLIRRFPYTAQCSWAVPVPNSNQSRLAYIDWMRGIACVLMFQTHCYDSWLSPTARQSKFFTYSQLGGTFPAPLFLFLAGISFALVTMRLCKKNLSPTEIARTTIYRGSQILAFGLLFRLQEYVIAWGWAPLSDLLRVDILNTIGLSMMLMGILCWAVLSVKHANAERILIGASTAVALLISLLTPLMWTSWRPDWLPWPIESYLNGVHNLGTPQAWLFPVFPWSAFAFAGLAAGFCLQTEWARKRETITFLAAGATGLALIAISLRLDHSPRHLYASYDYWHTSPNFFLIRLGMLLLILLASYAWCRWGAAQLGFSPLIQLGQASLLVYWVHIEFVYGRASILPKHGVSIRMASFGLLLIFLAMTALAAVRTRMKGRGVDVIAWFAAPQLPNKLQRNCRGAFGKCLLPGRTQEAQIGVFSE
jgi:uncharacterized membrane protein